MIMSLSGFSHDRIIGFESIAKLDQCSLDDYERRLAFNKMIDYEGDPRQTAKQQAAAANKSSGFGNVIRKSNLHKDVIEVPGTDDSDDDW